MRQKFIAGNWKMYTTGPTAEALASAVAQGLGNETRVRVALCPPFPYFWRVESAIRNSPIILGAQNFYPEPEGAFTGEVSATMLATAPAKSSARTCRCLCAVVISPVPMGFVR